MSKSKYLIGYQAKRDRRQAKEFRTYGSTRKKTKQLVRKLKAMEKRYGWS